MAWRPRSNNSMALLMLLACGGCGAAAGPSLSYDEDLSDLLSSGSANSARQRPANDCSTAEVLSEETKVWEEQGGRVQVAIRFPDWVQGTRVSVDTNRTE